MKHAALSLAFAAALAVAAQAETKAPTTAKTEHSKTAAAKAAKPMAMSVEVVSVDAEGKTLTVKGKTENKTYTVLSGAQTAVAALKPGEHATIWHDANDEVTSVKVAPAKKTSTAHAAPKAKTAVQK